MVGYKVSKIEEGSVGQFGKTYGELWVEAAIVRARIRMVMGAAKFIATIAFIAAVLKYLFS